MTEPTEHQILVEGMTEEEVREMFGKYRVATINFIKPYKTMLTVNFNSLWKKGTKRFPYFNKQLEYFLSDSNHKYLQRLYNRLMREAETISFGGSRNLYSLDGKTYQIVSKLNIPTDGVPLLRPVTVLDIFETDTYLIDKEYKLTEEEINTPML